MNRYKTLLQEQADLKAEGEGIFQKAEAEKRSDLTAEEGARIDAINARLEAIGVEMAREEKRRLWERTAPALDDGSRPAADLSRMGVDPAAGFHNLAEFALAVRNAGRQGGIIDARLLQIMGAPTGYMQEVGTGEGYMVPAEFRQSIWDMVFAQPDLLSMVDSEPTASNAVDLDADETTPWGTSGVTAKWRAEASQMTASKLDTEKRTVRLFELYAFVTATEELLADAPRLNNRLTTKSADAIRWKINEAIMNGTGAGQPLGWMKAGCLVSVAKEGAQGADTLVAANVAKMFARVLNPGRSIWFSNQDVVPQLMTMTLGDQPIWTPPSSGFQNAPGGFLFGRPIQFMDNCATLGDQGDIQLVDPKGYYAPRRQDAPQYAESIHLFFDYGMKAFRWTFRLGGQPYLSAAVTPAKGAATRSHFVVLDAR